MTSVILRDIWEWEMPRVDSVDGIVVMVHAITIRSVSFDVCYVLLQILWRCSSPMPHPQVKSPINWNSAPTKIQSPHPQRVHLRKSSKWVASLKNTECYNLSLTHGAVGRRFVRVSIIIHFPRLPISVVASSRSWHRLRYSTLTWFTFSVFSDHCVSGLSVHLSVPLSLCQGDVCLFWN